MSKCVVHSDKSYSQCLTGGVTHAHNHLYKTSSLIFNGPFQLLLVVMWIVIFCIQSELWDTT
jgi:hypothetical protein